MPSMAQASEIRDAAERHAYVFRNGLSDMGFFDLERRRKSEEFAVLSSHIEPGMDCLEVGCLTGLNSLLLAESGVRCHAVDFVPEAIAWLRQKASELGVVVTSDVAAFPCASLGVFDVVVCADVLEHQLDVGAFLAGVRDCLRLGGIALFIVPKGREYFDCGHAAFWPDSECLRNTLEYFFEVKFLQDLCDGRKLFAKCGWVRD